MPRVIMELSLSQLTKRSRGIPNARHFGFDSASVITAQWFRSGGLRCSPLNAALYAMDWNIYERI